MISRSLLPLLSVSSYRPRIIALLVMSSQSSHSGAMVRCVGLDVRSVFVAEVVPLPKVIKPLVLTTRLVNEVP